MSTVPFRLSSSAFPAGEAIPRRYSCDGPDVSPPLAWSGAPAGTAAFVLVVDDPDANGFVHWIVADLPAATTSLAEGASGHLSPAVEGRNGFGRIGYGGPCPPSGTHRYVFVLYALDRTLALGGAPRADAVRSAMKGHILAEAKLTATYRR
jgi:Raf kinase inhibitor-like YbhB/YbcL family protein